MSDGWKAKTRQSAAGELRSLREEITGRIDGLALAVADASTPEGLARPAELHKPASAFARMVTKRIEALGRTLSRSGGEPADQAEWRASIAPELAAHGTYLQGWLDGGGVFATLYGELDGGFDDPRRITKCLRTEMDFVAGRVEVAVQAWLEPLGGAGMPKPGSVADRVADVLHVARFWDIDIKVPAKPSAKWLDKLQPKLEAAIGKRRAKRLRLNKRKALLDFAEVMKITIKKVPDNPSDSYLEKLEAKLRQIAGKKGISVPELAGEPVAEPPPRAPSMGELLDPGLTEGPKTLLPGDDEEDEEAGAADTHAIIEEMLEKAERADLKLGRIPHEPSAQWILKTQQMLDEALDKKKAQRKAERQAKQKARKERIERIRTQAEAVGLDLGRFPPFPTDEWLGRIEMRIADKMLEVQQHSIQDGARRAAILDLLARAERAGVDLGELPPDPDEVWMSWAEGRIADTEMADQVFAVGEDPDEEDEEVPRVYFERGTVQEESWPLDKDRVVIGRARDADIQIRHDGGISRRHCALVRGDDGWVIEDMGSARGTSLDGVPVSAPLPLYPGATIMVGESALVFAFE